MILDAFELFDVCGNALRVGKFCVVGVVFTNRDVVVEV
jgi:hypothetical protein